MTGYDGFSRYMHAAPEAYGEADPPGVGETVYDGFGYPVGEFAAFGRRPRRGSRSRGAAPQPPPPPPAPPGGGGEGMPSMPSEGGETDPGMPGEGAENQEGDMGEPYFGEPYYAEWDEAPEALGEGVAYDGYGEPVGFFPFPRLLPWQPKPRLPLPFPIPGIPRPPGLLAPLVQALQQRRARLQRLIAMYRQRGLAVPPTVINQFNQIIQRIRQSGPGGPWRGGPPGRRPWPLGWRRAPLPYTGLGPKRLYMRCAVWPGPKGLVPGFALQQQQAQAAQGGGGRRRRLRIRRR